ncbi:DUF4288 domain-containing protein [Ferruginibacter sp. SUN106]|uniref:DUF4288 domain-containing protein n=1 Tax=Ferruginibacter sp. SUN106 TaxID=2978348 RepID=UPI003D35D5EB
MNWYMAKLVYQFICGSGKHTPQFNEQLRLIVAEDALHAFYKARLIGERETLDIVNNDISIQWRFIDVTEILPVDNLSDGAELWSFMNEDSDAELYIRNTQQKASRLLEQGMHEFDII